MPSVSDLLGRADESALTVLLGRDTVRLLRRIDSSLAVPSRLRALILETQSDIDLVRDGDKRRTLIDLMYPEEARNIAVALGLDSDQPFESLASEVFRKGSQMEAMLLEKLQVEMGSGYAQQLPDSLKTLPSGYGLFRHQRQAVSRCGAYLEESRTHRVLLHMPTGAGKTRTAMHIVANHLNEHEDSSVIWLANSEELCEQAAQEFEKAWRHLGTREVEIGRFWGNLDLNLGQLREGLLVAGLPKLYSRLQRDASSVQSLADRTGLVVFDEAHQAIAPTYQLVLDVLLSRKTDTRLLGLSATPGRSWNEIHRDEQLANFFSRQKVILQVDGYESPIDYLVEAGYLASPVFRDLLYEGGGDISDQDLEALERSLDVPRTLLEQLALDEQRNLLILSAVEDLAGSHSRIIVFAPSVGSANVLADVLSARGITAYSVTGTTDSNRRQRILDEYKSNDSRVRVIVNFGVLTTGFDAPQTSAAVIARPTKSLVLYSQMAGRALRGALVGGNANAEVVTIVDTTLPGFRAPGEMFMNWEDVW